VGGEDETKDVPQRVKVDATPPPPVGSVSDVTPGGDIARFDAEQVKDIDEDIKLFVTIGTKINPRKWVKKYEFQVVERDKLKLKAVVFHDGIGKEVRMTQPVQFVAEDLVIVA